MQQRLGSQPKNRVDVRKGIRSENFAPIINQMDPNSHTPRHVEAEDPSGWPLAGGGLIQAWRKRRRRERHTDVQGQTDRGTFRDREGDMLTETGRRMDKGGETIHSPDCLSFSGWLVAWWRGLCLVLHAGHAFQSIRKLCLRRHNGPCPWTRSTPLRWSNRSRIPPHRSNDPVSITLHWSWLRTEEIENYLRLEQIWFRRD